MTAVDRTTLKGYFNTNDRPTESNFANLIDSALVICASGQSDLHSTASLFSGTNGNISQSGSSITFGTTACISLSGSLSVGGAASVAGSMLISGCLSIGGSPVTASADSGSHAYLLLPNQTLAGITNAVIGATNQVNAYRFYLPNRVKISSLGFYVTTGSAAACAGNGLYNMAGGSLLIHSGALPADSTGVQRKILDAEYVLDQGYYIYAMTTSNSNVTFNGLAFGNNFQLLLNASVGQAGVAANSGTSGSLPATLGVITGSPTFFPFGVFQS